VEKSKGRRKQRRTTLGTEEDIKTTLEKLDGVS
jgi:hypothetical protein